MKPTCDRPALEITDAMISEGVRALRASGRLQHEAEGADQELVLEILASALEASSDSTQASRERDPALKTRLRIRIRLLTLKIINLLLDAPPPFRKPAFLLFKLNKPAFYIALGVVSADHAPPLHSE